MRQQMLNPAADSAQALLHPAIGNILDILLRIINHSLQINNNIHKLLTQSAQLTCQLSLLLTRSQLQASLTARTDNIHNRLSLRQINPAVQKRTLRKLAGLRRTRTGSKSKLQNLLQRLHTAVTLDFNHILRRIGTGSTHIHRQHLIYKAAVRIINMAISKRIHRICTKRLAGSRLKQGLTHRQRLRSANTHNTYSTFAKSRSNSTNRILSHMTLLLLSVLHKKAQYGKKAAANKPLINLTRQPCFVFYFFSSITT